MLQSPLNITKTDLPRGKTSNLCQNSAGEAAARSSISQDLLETYIQLRKMSIIEEKMLSRFANTQSEDKRF